MSLSRRLVRETQGTPRVTGYTVTPPRVGDRELFTHARSDLIHLANERGGFLCKPDVRGLQRDYTSWHEDDYVDFRRSQGMSLRVCPACQRRDERPLDTLAQP